LAVKHQKTLMSAELYQIILQPPFHHLQKGEAKNGYTIDRASGLTLSITTNLLACFSRLGSIEFYSFHNAGGRPTQNSHSEVDTNTYLGSSLAEGKVFKGSLTRDFRLQVLFTNHFPSGP
jgi:hypothetical protein